MTKTTVKELIEDERYEYSYTGTGQRIQHHAVKDCIDRMFCCIHRASNHHMTMWPLHFRADRPPLMERMCRHGVGHPDPDCLKYLNDTDPDGGWAVHGCDGCCRKTDGYFGDQ